MFNPHDLMVPPKDVPQMLEDTWHETGHKIIPQGPRLYVRTWRIPEKVGRIYLPPTMLNVYKGLPHSKLMRATVVAVPRSGKFGLKVGDFIVFPQTFFARYKYMTDGTLLGYLHPMFVHGRIELEALDLQRIVETQEGRVLQSLPAALAG